MGGGKPGTLVWAPPPGRPMVVPGEQIFRLREGAKGNRKGCPNGGRGAEREYVPLDKIAHSTDGRKPLERRSRRQVGERTGGASKFSMGNETGVTERGGAADGGKKNSRGRKGGEG